MQGKSYWKWWCPWKMHQEGMRWQHPYKVTHRWIKPTRITKRTIWRSRGGPRAYGKGLYRLASLSLSLTAPQIMATLKVVTHPLIQVNTLEGLLDKVKTPRKVELPDDMGARVKLTMTPNPKAECLQKEKDNSPTQYYANLGTELHNERCRLNTSSEWKSSQPA